ncbi:enoyl-ACP reductase [Acidiferrobacter sp.]|uniref:enoyl-ACP reductase FabI n=1 Tax=Acidiferrobacter sp. TaxID=1872107 RepID=UPI00261E637B|nr:enoyl-ACP reductase [Acidiferrobacter sp.]
MGFLAGKRAVVIGALNERSIAWGIAQAMHAQGAEIAYTYQNDKLQSRVEGLAALTGSHIVLPCDVGRDEDINALFEGLRTAWPDGFDALIHSVAYAPRDQLEGDYLDAVTREGFLEAHNISSYSFAALAKGARPALVARKGSLLTLSYLGAVRVVPHYNVMGLAKASLEANVRYLAQSLGRHGVRVNGISAGPIKTLAAAGISDFRRMLDYYERNAPLHRGVTIEEVGHAAAFLSSDLASGITGEILYVDSGYHMVGMGEGAE